MPVLTFRALTLGGEPTRCQVRVLRDAASRRLGLAGTQLSRHPKRLLVGLPACGLTHFRLPVSQTAERVDETSLKK